MKILKVYVAGFTTIIKRFRLISLAYLSLLIPALLVALPFLSNFKSAASQYISPGKLLEGFDYTAYSELMNFRGDEIKAALSQGSWLFLFYILISVFVTGAILYILHDKNKKAKFVTFLKGGSKYFWRFFRLSLIFVIFHLLIALILYLPFGIMVITFEHTATEKSAFFMFLPFGIMHLFIAIYLLTVSNYSRFILVQEDSRKVFKSIWKSLKFVSAKFLGAYGLILLLFIFPVAMLIVYFEVSAHVEMTSGLLILVGFLVQQFYLWLREASRVWAYSSQFDYYLMVHKEREQPTDIHKQETLINDKFTDQIEQEIPND